MSRIFKDLAEAEERLHKTHGKLIPITGLEIGKIGTSDGDFPFLRLSVLDADVHPVFRMLFRRLAVKIQREKNGFVLFEVDSNKVIASGTSSDGSYLDTFLELFKERKCWLFMLTCMAMSQTFRIDPTGRMVLQEEDVQTFGQGMGQS